MNIFLHSWSVESVINCKSSTMAKSASYAFSCKQRSIKARSCETARKNTYCVLWNPTARVKWNFRTCWRILSWVWNIQVNGHLYLFAKWPRVLMQLWNKTHLATRALHHPPDCFLLPSSPPHQLHLLLPFSPSLSSSPSPHSTTKRGIECLWLGPLGLGNNLVANKSFREREIHELVATNPRKSTTSVWISKPISSHHWNHFSSSH